MLSKSILSKRLLNESNIYNSYITHSNLSSGTNYYESDICFVQINRNGDNIQERLFCYVDFIEDYSKYTGYYEIRNKRYFIEREKYLSLNKNLIRDYSAIRSYLTFIKVINDRQNPELNGQILLFKFGKFIKDKLTDDNITYNNIFRLKVGKVNQFLDYSPSYFIDKKYSVNHYTLSLDHKLRKSIIDLDNLNRNFKLMKIKRLMK